MTKHIKLMPDYFARGLWSLDPGTTYPVDPKDLPISDETVALLQAWTGKYDSLLNIDDPASSNFLKGDELLEFEREGVRLWLKLREELLPDYEVSYFSQILRKLLKDPSELQFGNQPPSA